MHPQFDPPSRGSIAGRSSSITAAFFQAIIPVIAPSDQDVDEALQVLGMSSEHCVCAYCGDTKTEWDHFRPIVEKQLPTGYITEIQNLVPACGKCNQSKGNKHWRTWMLGSAPRAPFARSIPDLNTKVDRLAAYEGWRPPTRLDIPAIVGSEAWQSHLKRWKGALAALAEAQTHAAELRHLIETHLRVA